jgi:Leucine-rich repeat (LRR) protein
MTEDAVGKEVRVSYLSWSHDNLWPTNKQCYTENIDLSAKFENEPHTFSGTPTEKSELKTFQVRYSDPVDFVPLGILTEFPNINGLIFNFCTMPVVKAGLLKPEFKVIEYLYLGENHIDSIERDAFQYLTKLKWIRLYNNNIKTLSYKIFSNNPDLIYIDLENNKINSIHPNFFDGLTKLKEIELNNNPCVDFQSRYIGCDDCLINQDEINRKLQSCFNKCSEGSECLASYLAHEN